MAETAATPTAPAAAEEPVAKGTAGRSYWDIVFTQFRKNRLAVVALVLILGIYAISVFTPFFANDRPLRMRGSMPGIYARMFREYKSAAHGEFVRMPEDLEGARKRWRERKVTMKDFNRLIRVEDWHAFGAGIEREKVKFLVANPNDFKWKTDAVEIGAVRATLAPLEQEALDRTAERVVEELGEIYRTRLEATFGAIRVKLQALATQLPDSFDAPVAAAIAEYRAALDSGYLEAPKEARAPVKQRLDGVRDRLAADFDPEKVALVSRTLWPAFAALRTIDAFLMTASFMLLFVVPPLLRFTPLGRGASREVKFRRGLWLTLVPVLVLTGWRAAQPNLFETIDFKRSLADGSIVTESVTHAPIYFGMNEQDTAQKFQPPSSRHWFGTDENGRDLLTRMMWGSRISLSVGFVATGIALFIGVTVGSLAGFYRGKVDMVLSRIIELVLCFPSLFIVLAVIAVLPPSIYNVMIVLGIFGWTGIARLTRAEFFRLVDQDFVTAGRALGAGDFRLIFRHVLPNSLGPVLVAASFSVASAILTESGLSFLGFGVTPPDTSWGSILSTARENPTYYWLVMIPGFAIFVTVTLYNLLGEGIRDAIDPRMRM